MKKKTLVLALALMLGISTAAMAETKQCKSTQGQGFTMEVPDGWAFKEIPGGCAAAKADSSEFISVAYYPANGINAKSFARQLIERMKVQAKISKEEDGYVDFDCTVNGEPVNISVTGEGKEKDEELQVVTQKGESETLEKIFDSVTF